MVPWRHHHMLRYLEVRDVNKQSGGCLCLCWQWQNNALHTFAPSFPGVLCQMSSRHHMVSEVSKFNPQHKKRASLTCSEHSDKKKCPAFQNTCRKHHQQGHWAQVCCYKTLNKVTEYRTASVSGDISEAASIEKRIVTLHIGNVPLIFKIETEADVTVIGEKTLLTLTKAHRPGPADRPFGGKLSLRGWFRAYTVYTIKEYTSSEYETCRKSSHLLSCPDAVKTDWKERSISAPCSERVGC